VPEGDTIHRAARTLQSAIGGQIVTRFETALAQLAAADDQQPIAGRRVERVFAAGKHLIIEFSGDLYLRTHMRMNGSWHIYRPGERWMRRRGDMRIVIATGGWVAVGFNVPVAEMHTARSLARQEDLRKIGPDLLEEAADIGEGVRRIRQRAGSEIANVLLNQRVVAGIGNVYKSEALFMERINPFALVESLSDARLQALLRTAQTIRRPPHDRPVAGSGGAVGVRAPRGALPPLRHAHRISETGGGRPRHLLVSPLPALRINAVQSPPSPPSRSAPCRS